MIDQETINRINHAIRLLSTQDTLLRLSTIEELMKIGIIHPHILQILEIFEKNPTSLKESLAAKDAIDYLKTVLPEGNQIVFS